MLGKVPEPEQGRMELFPEIGVLIGRLAVRGRSLEEEGGDAGKEGKSVHVACMRN